MLKDTFPLDLNIDIEAMETEVEYKEFLEDMIKQTETLCDPTGGDPTTKQLKTTYLKEKNGATQANADEIAASFLFKSEIPPPTTCRQVLIG